MDMIVGVDPAPGADHAPGADMHVPCTVEDGKTADTEVGVGARGSRLKRFRVNIELAMMHIAMGMTHNLL